MKVVFAHDHVFFRFGNSYYSRGGFLLKFSVDTQRFLTS